MKQVYTPWWLWEDYHAGMWRKVPKDEEPLFLKSAIEFTGDHIRYGNAMWIVVNLWGNTMLNSLTDPSKNKRAFVGHCAAQYAINCPEYIVRQAWFKLTENQRILADEQAQNCINKWSKRYETILKYGSNGVMGMAYQMNVL